MDAKIKIAFGLVFVLVGVVILCDLVVIATNTVLPRFVLFLEDSGVTIWHFIWLGLISAILYVLYISFVDDSN